MPTAASASAIAHTTSASASGEGEPTMSRSHWGHSRNRPRPGRSARQTGPITNRLYGVGSWEPYAATTRASGTVMSYRSARSASPLASCSPRRRILKISLSPSSPYRPVSVSSRSKAGVCSGSKPYRWKTSRMAVNTCSRTRRSPARKSLVPEGGSNCWDAMTYSSISGADALPMLLVAGVLARLLGLVAGHLGLPRREGHAGVTAPEGRTHAGCRHGPARPVPPVLEVLAGAVRSGRGGGRVRAGRDRGREPDRGRLSPGHPPARLRRHPLQGEPAAAAEPAARRHLGDPGAGADQRRRSLRLLPHPDRPRELPDQRGATAAVAASGVAALRAHAAPVGSG